MRGSTSFDLDDAHTKLDILKRQLAFSRQRNRCRRNLWRIRLYAYHVLGWHVSTSLTVLTAKTTHVGILWPPVAFTLSPLFGGLCDATYQSRLVSPARASGKEIGKFLNIQPRSILRRPIAISRYIRPDASVTRGTSSGSEMGNSILRSLLRLHPF